MAAAPMTSDQAAAAVAARLGRPATDALEAAVVLEAWRGLGPAAALEHGRAAATAPPPAGRPQPEPRRSIAPPPQPGQAVGLLVVLTAVLAWAGPLGGWVGTDALGTGWRTALPVVLGAQWFVQTRLVEGQRAAQLGRHRRRVLLAGALIVTAVLGLPEGALVVVLVLALPWAGLVVLVEARRSRLTFLAITIVVALLLHSGAPPRLVMASYALAVLMLLDRACAQAPTSTQRLHPLVPSLLGGGVGLGLGLLLVTGVPPQAAPDGAAVVLMFPSVLGGLWASSHLRRLWVELPTSLRSATLELGSRAPQAGGSVVAAALARYLAATVTVSAIALVVLPGGSEGLTPVALAYASFGLTGVLAGLAWSLGRDLTAASWVLLAVVAATAVGSQAPGPAALIVGASVASLGLVPAIAISLHRMEHTFATRIQIP